MSKREGILTKEQENFIVEALMFWFNLKSGFLAKIIKRVLTWIIRLADNKGADKIPEAWRVDLIPIVDAAMAGKIELTRKLVADLLNKKIDIPKLDDEQELQTFDAFTKFLVTVIDYYIQKKK